MKRKAIVKHKNKDGNNLLKKSRSWKDFQEPKEGSKKKIK